MNFRINPSPTWLEWIYNGICPAFVYILYSVQCTLYTVQYYTSIWPINHTYAVATAAVMTGLIFFSEDIDYIWVSVYCIGSSLRQKIRVKELDKPKLETEQNNVAGKTRETNPAQPKHKSSENV